VDNGVLAARSRIVEDANIKELDIPRYTNQVGPFGIFARRPAAAEDAGDVRAVLDDGCNIKCREVRHLDQRRYDRPVNLITAFKPPVQLAKPLLMDLGIAGDPRRR